MTIYSSRQRGEQEGRGGAEFRGHGDRWSAFGTSSLGCSLCPVAGQASTGGVPRALRAFTGPKSTTPSSFVSGVWSRRLQLISAPAMQAFFTKKMAGEVGLGRAIQTPGEVLLTLN